MHFEILVEDKSGSIAVNAILEKILGANYLNHSWTLHAYKGIGRIPRNLRGTLDPAKRILLDRLPKILQGYGRSLDSSLCAVIIVLDLDNRDCMAFKRNLIDILDVCDPRPNALFRFAIEESESWLLGDRNAIKAAYPYAKDGIMNSYEQDSICNTWEVLADAVQTGGAARLRKSGWPEIGVVKCEWAENIAPHMDVNSNRSKSFQVFRDGVRRLAGIH